jgi:hypothetical protein
MVVVDASRSFEIARGGPVRWTRSRGMSADFFSFGDVPFVYLSHIGLMKWRR